MPDQDRESDSRAFQLFEGGSFFGLENVLGRVRPDLLDSRSKIVIVILIGWLPLLILSAFQGMAVGKSRPESFLLDASVQARFVVALPIIILVPEKISGVLRAIVEHFPKAKLVKESERERFVGNVASAMRLRHAPLADWLILALVYIISGLLLMFVVPSLPPSWRTLGGQRLSLAGWWMLVVSEPLYEFVFYRFLYRVVIWWIFLWKTSRLDLQLDAAHPDRAGGLGFLGLSLRTFKEAAFAISTTFAAGLANIVLLTHSKVSSYRYAILVVVVFSIGLFACPLLFFFQLLSRRKSSNLLEYWVLWQRQQRQFDQKWLLNPEEHADMLGVADFSEATDLSSILERVQQVRLVPFRQAQALPLIIAAVLPFLAVLTLEFPVEEIVKQLLKMRF